MRVEFAQTPRMSTYLVAWVVAPFQAVSAETETNKINVSVVTSKEKIDQVGLSYMPDAPSKTKEKTWNGGGGADSLFGPKHNFFRYHLHWMPL